MRKKILTGIMLCLSMMVGLFMTACGVNDIKSITVKGNAYSEFVVGESYNYGNITVEIVFDDDTTLTVNGNDERIAVSGFSTETANPNGQMTIKFSDKKATAQCTIDYVVYSNAQTIETENDIDKITEQAAEDDSSVLFFKNGGEYDLANVAIKRDLKLVARANQNVVLKNVKIDSKTAAKNLNVSLNNVTLMNGAEKGVCLNVVDNTSYDLNLTLNKCTIVANGTASRGVVIPTKGNVLISECKFETPNDNDVFDYLVTYASSARSLDNTCVIKKNQIVCNFAYAFANMHNYTLEDNFIDATLRSTGIGATSDSANSQTFYVNKKNPVVIHCSLPSTLADGYKYFITCKNNTVKNAQNFIRAYQFDRYDYTTEIDMTFENNKLENCAVLVNASTLCQSSLPNILADVTADIKTGYVSKYKSVIEKDTVIELPNEQGIPSKFVAQTTAYIYYDFETMNDTAAATMTIDNTEYIFVANATNMVGGTPIKNYIIKDHDNNFYVIDYLDYSPKGDVLNFYAEAGTTKNIAEAKVFTLTEVKEMLGLSSILSND